MPIGNAAIHSGFGAIYWSGPEPEALVSSSWLYFIV